MHLVDSHCHLNFPELRDDLEGVMARAKENNVQTLLTINTKLSESAEVIHYADKYPHVYASVGVHPCDVAKEGVPSYDKLLSLTQHPKVVGLGETGLDYYYETESKTLQQESLRTHMKVSKETGLPLIIHSRETEADLLQILEEMKEVENPGVIHCFTGTRAFAEKVLDWGFYISISGVVTFKKATDLQGIVMDLPLDRILVETDSPYLAPVPKRGKPNEPSYVAYTAQKVAELKGLSLEDVALHTTANFYRLFSKAASPTQEGAS